MNKVLYGRFSNIYIFLISSSVFPILAISTPLMNSDRVVEIIFWIIMEIVADLKSIATIRSGEISEITTSLAVQLSAVVLLGTWEATWIIVVATLLAEMISRKPFRKALFNAGQYGITLLTTGYAFHWLKLSPDGVVLDIIKDLPALFIGVSVYFFLNLFLVSLVITLTSGSSFAEVFFSDLRIFITYFFTLLPIGVAMVLLYDPGKPYIILIMVPPVFMADQALRRFFSLQRQTQETLNVLADIIDERDSYTALHSSRVAEYSRKIAIALNLPHSDIEEIEMAGRVHDLGKISVKDGVLLKPGRLTDEEFIQITQHPETGYKLIKNLKLYKNAADFVLYHHEKLDGSGYPHKLTAAAIPFGAKILAVADSYDAMTTDRPYRGALPQQVAVAELLKHSGTQFDPGIVQAFIKVLQNDYGYMKE